MKTFENLRIVHHPVLSSSLTVIRSKDTPTNEFVSHANTIATIMIQEATRFLETVPYKVQTPLAPYIGNNLENSVIFVPILRAGLSMVDAAQKLVPSAKVGFIGMARDEETAIAKAYYHKLPHILSHSQVFILDPMLATGGSMNDSIAEIKKQGAKKIISVCIVAAPEGVTFLSEKHPDVVIYTAALDSHLNDKKYIVPGLGDFGDRYFGTE